MRESISPVLGVQGWGRKGSGLLRTACRPDPVQGAREVEASPCRDGKVDWGGGGGVTESSEVSQSPHMSRDAAKGAHHSDCCCPDKEERVHALPHVMVLPPLPL